MIWERKRTIQGETRVTTVRYYVTERTYDAETDCFCYGLGIGDETDTFFVPAFAKERAQAVRAAEMLWRGKVTPVSFYAVLDDYLAEIH